MGVKKGRLCNVPPKPKQMIVGKSTVQDTAVRTQDTTLTLHLLGRAQDFLGGTLQACSFLRICWGIFTKILLSFMEMFETKDFVSFSAMPLFLCCALLSGVGRTFIDEKPCPKLKRVIKGKSTVQDNTVSFYVLETAQHFLGRRLQGCSFLRIC